MSREHFIIKSAKAEKANKLAVEFKDGFSAMVDLSEVLKQTPFFKPLLKSKTFEKVSVGNFGRDVEWPGDIEMAGDNLRNLAVEQAGGIGHERIVTWMYRNHLTQEQAADAIGISRRMLNYYVSGEKPIPRTVWLACVGHEAIVQQLESEKELNQHLMEISARVEEAVVRVDQQMDAELKKALSTFGQQLSALSERFVDDYTPLTDRLRDVVSITSTSRSHAA